MLCTSVQQQLRNFSESAVSLWDLITASNSVRKSLMTWQLAGMLGNLQQVQLVQKLRKIKGRQCSSWLHGFQKKKFHAQIGPVTLATRDVTVVIRWSTVPDAHRTVHCSLLITCTTKKIDAHFFFFFLLHKLLDVTVLACLLVCLFLSPRWYLSWMCWKFCMQCCDSLRFPCLYRNYAELTWNLRHFRMSNTESYEIVTRCRSASL